MIEPRRQLRLAQKPLELDIVAAQPAMQHLDHGLTAKRGLFAAIHRAEAAFVESLAKHEFSHSSPGQIVLACHPRHRNTCDPKIACVRGLTPALPQERREMASPLRNAALSLINYRCFHDPPLACSSP
jgi:hypothetical protein